MIHDDGACKFARIYFKISGGCNSLFICFVVVFKFQLATMILKYEFSQPYSTPGYTILALVFRCPCDAL